VLFVVVVVVAHHVFSILELDRLYSGGFVGRLLLVLLVLLLLLLFVMLVVLMVVVVVVRTFSSLLYHQGRTVDQLNQCGVRLWRRISRIRWPVDFQFCHDLLQGTDPFISSLAFQGPILPVGFVFYIRRKSQFGLALEVLNVNIKRGRIVSSFGFEKFEHLAS